MATQMAAKASYKMRVTDPVESQLIMLKKLDMDEDAYANLIDPCECINIQIEPPRRGRPD